MSCIEQMLKSQIIICPLLIAFRGFFVYVIRKITKSQEKGKRITESAYFCIQYFLLTILAIFIAVKHQYFTTNAVYSDKQLSSADSIRQLYVNLQFGVYITACGWLFSETRKHDKDFMLMVAHHVVTLCIISLSAQQNLHNYIIAGAALHDVSDVLLEISKIVYYFGKRKLSNITWAIFTLSFTSTRLYIIPRFMVLPWFKDAFHPIPKWFMFTLPPFLCALVLMQAIWSFFIVRVCINMITGAKGYGKGYTNE